MGMPDELPVTVLQGNKKGAAEAAPLSDRLPVHTIPNGGRRKLGDGPCSGPIEIRMP